MLCSLHWAISNILITARSVSSDIKILEKWVVKLGGAAIFQDRLRGVWISVETLSSLSQAPRKPGPRNWESSNTRVKREERLFPFLLIATTWITRSHCFSYASCLLSESLKQAKLWVECWYNFPHKRLFLRNSKLNVANFLMIKIRWPNTREIVFMRDGIYHTRGAFHPSEFTQQDGKKKRKAKRLFVTNVTGLLIACFVVILN